MSPSEALRVLEIPASKVRDSEFVKKQTRIALRKSHPDMGGSSDAFHMVNEAIEVIKGQDFRVRLDIDKVEEEIRRDGSVQVFHEDSLQDDINNDPIGKMVTFGKNIFSFRVFKTVI